LAILICTFEVVLILADSLVSMTMFYLISIAFLLRL